MRWRERGRERETRKETQRERDRQRDTDRGRETERGNENSITLSGVLELNLLCLAGSDNRFSPF